MKASTMQRFVLVASLLSVASASCACTAVGDYCNFRGTAWPFTGTCHGAPFGACSCKDCGASDPTKCGSPPSPTPPTPVPPTPTPPTPTPPTPTPPTPTPPTPTPPSSLKCGPTDDATECAALKAIYLATNGPDWLQLGTGAVLKFDGSSYCTWHGVRTGFVFSGVLCDETTKKAKLLYLESLNLKGTLPDEIGDFAGLEELHLWNNAKSKFSLKGGLSGTIPATIAKLTSLKILEMQINNFTGTVPSTLGAMAKSLHVIKLDKNMLSGPLPASFCDFATTATVTNCDFGGNPFACPLPAACAAKLLSVCNATCA